MLIPLYDHLTPVVPRLFCGTTQSNSPSFLSVQLSCFRKGKDPLFTTLTYAYLIVLKSVQHLLLQELEINLRHKKNVTFDLAYVLERVQKFLLRRLPEKSM